MVGERNFQKTSYGTKKKTIKKIKFSLLLVLLSIIILFSTVSAEQINLTSGHIYSSVLHSSISSDSWAGITVVHDSTTLMESYSPFLSASLGTNTIIQSTFPGYNLNDGSHFYMASLTSSYDPNNLQNISSDDLKENALFNSSQFSVFYPDYNGTTDNPENTFCCTTKKIILNGKEIIVFDIVLEDNVHYYLGKYNDSGYATPLFISPIRNETCFNSTPCVSEFLLPENSLNYYFYALGDNASSSTNNYASGGGRDDDEDEDVDRDVFSLNLTIPEIIEVNQGEIASVVFKVANNGSLPSFHYIVGPVVHNQWEFSYKDSTMPIYPGAERVGRFFIEPSLTNLPGEYSVLVSLYDPDHHFLVKKYLTLVILEAENISLSLDINETSFVDIPQVQFPTTISFLITNPTDRSLNGVVARSSDFCVRRVEGEHSLASKESAWLDYDITFSRLPCDATLEFYSGSTFLGFKHLNSSVVPQEIPEHYSLFFSSFFKLFVLLVWLLLLIFGFRRDSRRKKSVKNNIYSLK